MEKSSLLVALIISSILTLNPSLVFGVILEPGDEYSLERFQDSDTDASSCPGLNRCEAFASLDPPELYTVATVELGAIEAERRAWAKAFYRFQLSPNQERRLKAKFKGFADWEGRIFIGAGSYSEARFRIYLKIKELQPEGSWKTIVDQKPVEEKCSNGLFDVISCEKFWEWGNEGIEQLDVDFDVIRGRWYEIQLEANCYVNSGLAGALAECDFYPGVIFDDLLLSIEPDYLELIENLREDFESHYHEYQTGKGKGHYKEDADSGLPNYPQR